MYVCPDWQDLYKWSLSSIFSFLMLLFNQNPKIHAVFVLHMQTTCYQLEDWRGEKTAWWSFYPKHVRSVSKHVVMGSQYKEVNLSIDVPWGLWPETMATMRVWLSFKFFSLFCRILHSATVWVRVLLLWTDTMTKATLRRITFNWGWLTGS